MAAQLRPCYHAVGVGCKEVSGAAGLRILRRDHCRRHPRLPQRLAEQPGPAAVGGLSVEGPQPEPGRRHGARLRQSGRRAAPRPSAVGRRHGLRVESLVRSARLHRKPCGGHGDAAPGGQRCRGYIIASGRALRHQREGAGLSQGAQRAAVHHQLRIKALDQYHNCLRAVAVAACGPRPTATARGTRDRRGAHSARGACSACSARGARGTSQ